jgi:hypothetical protein
MGIATSKSCVKALKEHLKRYYFWQLLKRYRMLKRNLASALKKIRLKAQIFFA